VRTTSTASFFPVLLSSRRIKGKERGEERKDKKREEEEERD
jgi:hypothetical protein